MTFYFPFSHPCAISLHTFLRSAYFQSSPSSSISSVSLPLHLLSTCPLIRIICLSNIITTLLSSLIHILIDLSFLSIHTYLLSSPLHSPLLFSPPLSSFVLAFYLLPSPLLPSHFHYSLPLSSSLSPRHV